MLLLDVGTCAGVVLGVGIGVVLGVGVVDAEEVASASVLLEFGWVVEVTPSVTLVSSVEVGDRPVVVVVVMAAVISVSVVVEAKIVNCQQSI